MGQLTVRNIDHRLLVRLKRKAWQEGLPLETYLRQLLTASVETEDFDMFCAPAYAGVMVEADSTVRPRWHA
jgi:plasmid stability protein